jgi:cardiolipin synthase A/B
MMNSVSVWNSERIFNRGQEYFEALLAELENVQRSVDVETYIFEDDALGRQVVSRLCALGRRGIQVRVMVDGVGSPGFYSRFGADLTAAGVMVRIFNPSPWDLTLFSSRLFPGLSRLIQFFWSANRRNHRKVVILDHRTVYTGGMNVSAKQDERYSGHEAWRDTGVRIEGREITEFIKAFDVAWSHAWSPQPVRKTIHYYWRRYRARKRVRGQALVQFNFTRYLRRKSNIELIRNLSEARDRVWITTAYFIPERSILRAIRTTAQRGVDVRIIVPCKSDVFFTPWVSSAYYFKLLKAGVKIYEYLPCMIHAKTLLIDSWGMVGTANLNHRSVFHDLEVNVMITTQEGIENLARQFQIDQEKSRRVTVEDWKNRSIFERAVGQVLLNLKYWF